MANPLIARIGAVMFAGVVLVGCNQDSASVEDQAGGMLTGGSATGAGSDGFQPQGQELAQVDITSITPSVDFEAGTQEELRALVGDRIFFDTDSSELNDRAKAVLGELLAWMVNNPTATVRVEGHADERGTREYNLALGDRRANAVVSYLLENGLEASRLTTISFGKERPVVGGSNASAWTQNRRAVFSVQ